MDKKGVVSLLNPPMVCNFAKEDAKSIRPICCPQEKTMRYCTLKFKEPHHGHEESKRNPS